MASSKEFREFDSSILADRLGFMAISLFVIYSITLLASIVPVRLLDTAWQLRFISACLDTAAIPLVALGLLHLAAYLDPENPVLQKRRKGVAHLAMFAAIGFLLIVPLQTHAAWRNVALANATVTRQLSAAAGTFDLLQNTITNASSLDQLRARLLAIQAPSLGIPFENLALPLPEIKQKMLVRLKAVRKQVEARIRSSAAVPIGSAVRDSLRVVISSLAFAIAFAMGAQRKGSDVPLLVEWHTIWTMRGARRQQSQRSWPSAGLSLGATPSPQDQDYFERLVPPEDEPPPSN